MLDCWHEEILLPRPRHVLRRGLRRRGQSVDAKSPRQFKVGDRVRIARKVEMDSKGRHCGWVDYMDANIGQIATVEKITGDQYFADRVLANDWWYSPEALDPIDAADESSI